MSRDTHSPITWDDQGTPHSTHFQDIYRSASALGGGWAQAREVFLRGCGLLDTPAAWAHAPNWTVLETGFGLGLNFLATWHAWRADPLRPKRLHMVSIESAPVSVQDLRRSVADWPELHELAEALAQQWWGLEPGMHRLAFEDGRVMMTLLVGPIQEWATPQGLRGQCFKADNVYLDGFNPTLNPEMWSLPSLTAIAAHARHGTRVASWCVAAPVRMALTQLGFTVQRVPGLPPKRHRLQAQCLPPAAPGSFTQPLHSLPLLTHPPQPPEKPPQRPTLPAQAWVLGAGLAGASWAREWAERGVRVTVLDAHPGAAMGASGLPVGLFTPHGAHQRPELHALTLAGLRHMQQLAQRLLQQGEDWAPSGVCEQLIPNRRGTQAPLPQEPTVLPGQTDFCQLQPGWAGHSHPALRHVHAGWIKPAALVRALLNHPLIECRLGVQVTRIEATQAPGDLAPQWRALGPKEELWAQAEAACVAAGPGSETLLKSLTNAPLKLHAVRGQVSLVPMSAVCATTQGLPLQCVNGQGSWIPNIPMDWSEVHLPPQASQGEPVSAAFTAPSNFAVFGSGFDHLHLDNEVRSQDHEDNLNRLGRLFPAADLQALRTAPWAGWAGLRCTTPDRLPWCGPWPGAATTAPQPDLIAPPGPPGPPGLWVLTALGARGLTLAALLAHAMVCQACGEPSPLSLDLHHALRPGR